jgi:hypothetical protein
MTREKLNIRIFDIDDDDHTVPAEVLINVLKHLQHSVFLIAMNNENTNISERARPNAEIRKKYALRCSIPVSGSYAQPLTLGDPTGDLFAQEKISQVAESLEASLEAIASGATESFNRLFHSNDCRNRVAESIKNLLPKAGQKWKVGFSRLMSMARPEVVLSSTIHKHIQEMIRPVESEVVPQTVNGLLHAMDFAKKSITILHPETQKHLECFYEESLEIELVENRRELVQVTGTVVKGINDEIKEIVDVESIEAVDLSDFVIENIPFNGGLLKLKSSLVLKPFLNDSKQLLCIEHNELGINVFAFTRENLLEELQEQLAALWIEYALEDDAKLTNSARELKHFLLAAFEEDRK